MNSFALFVDFGSFAVHSFITNLASSACSERSKLRLPAASVLSFVCLQRAF
jgi:hypothetical protein